MNLHYTAVVGMAADRAIGKNGTMPWHLPQDLKVFKELTMGHPILMGRKTFESIGRPLPGRQNIILSRQKGVQREGVIWINHLQELECIDLMDEEIMVIGGAEIYSLMLPYLSKLWVSLVDGEYEADTYFPEFKSYFKPGELVEEYDGFDLYRFIRA